MRAIYAYEVTHNGLGKHRIIRGSDKLVVQEKVRLQMREWDNMWARRCQAENIRQERAKATEERRESLARERQERQTEKEEKSGRENSGPLFRGVDLAYLRRPRRVIRVR